MAPVLKGDAEMSVLTGYENVYDRELVLIENRRGQWYVDTKKIRVLTGKKSRSITLFCNEEETIDHALDCIKGIKPEPAGAPFHFMILDYSERLKAGFAKVVAMVVLTVFVCFSLAFSALLCLEVMGLREQPYLVISVLGLTFFLGIINVLAQRKMQLIRATQSRNRRLIA